MVSPVVAISCSDIHLSATPPIARAEEPDWFKAMERPWQEIKELQREWKGCPILCAGDLFDRAQSNPPELINWILDTLPNFYGIAGNHDLPSHSPELLHKSSFGTLIRVGKVTPLGRKPTYVRELALYGTTLGKKPPRPVHEPGGLLLQVCLIHTYIWTKGTGYRGAPEEQRLGRLAKQFDGWDVVCVGDNHHAFTHKLKSGTTIVNTGTLMRRKSDEIPLRPQVGLIHRDGSVTPHYLDTSKDVITKLVHEEEKDMAGMENLFAELKKEGKGNRLDYREACKKVDCSEPVRKLLLESVGD